LGVALGTVLLPAIAGAQHRLSIVFEGGPVWTGYNNLRIPGDAGTRLSFADELRTSAQAYWRARGELRLGERHRIALLVAPLRLGARGSVSHEVRFQQATFPQNAALDGRFRFDSYRLTWTYDLLKRGRVELGAGLTAKIRDASISLSAPGRFAEKTNTGFVPLIHLRGRARLSQRLAAVLDVDAAAAPQGRAEDVLVALDYSLGRSLSARVGYRLLEGGADNAQVYTFTWLNYAVAGLVARF
jgi:hypothetical protein